MVKTTFEDPRHVLELRRCKNDPIYFINKYCKVQKFTGVADIKLTKQQELVIEALVNGKSFTYKDHRQTGRTLCLAGYTLWLCLLKKRKKVFYGCCNRTAPDLVADQFSFMLNGLPVFFYQQVVRSLANKFFQFDNGSMVTFYQMDPISHRGCNLDLYIGDDLDCSTHHSAILNATGALKQRAMTELGPYGLTPL